MTDLETLRERNLRKERGKLAADLEDVTSERNELRSALRDLRKLTKRSDAGQAGEPDRYIFTLPNSGPVRAEGLAVLARVDALLKTEQTASA